MEAYETVTEAIQSLRDLGYTADFNLQPNGIACNAAHSFFLPSEFVIDKVFRFEGITDPADEMILYAISALSENKKGLLLDGYGVYSDQLTNEMVNKLNYS